MMLTFQTLTSEELHPQLLQNFTRYQETRRAWVPIGDEIVLQDTYFVDEWDNEKKAKVVRQCRSALESGGIVSVVYRQNQVKGFSVLEGQRFGSGNQYIELTYLHISQELRGRGIGRQLFLFTCDQARRLEVPKLYISAHPAEETQAFYSAMGCVLTMEINPDILAREPLDIQLELTL